MIFTIYCVSKSPSNCCRQTDPECQLPCVRRSFFRHFSPKSRKIKFPTERKFYSAANEISPSYARLSCGRELFNRSCKSIFSLVSTKFYQFCKSCTTIFLFYLIFLSRRTFIGKSLKLVELSDKVARCCSIREPMLGYDAWFVVDRAGSADGSEGEKTWSAWRLRLRARFKISKRMFDEGCKIEFISNELYAKVTGWRTRIDASKRISSAALRVIRGSKCIECISHVTASVSTARLGRVVRLGRNIPRDGAKSFVSDIGIENNVRDGLGTTWIVVGERRRFSRMHVCLRFFFFSSPVSQKSWPSWI